MRLIQIGKEKNYVSEVAFTAVDSDFVFIPDDFLGYRIGKFVLGNESVPDEDGRMRYDCACQNCGFSALLYPEEMLNHTCER
jgi:hypothetical protein